jgi:histidinol phosphatase-like PHP family hydrolase
MNFDSDIHVHTLRSPCGKEEMIPADILRVALDMGLDKIAITDHFYPVTDAFEIEETRQAFEEAQLLTGNPIEIFFGCEAEIMGPGRTAGSTELAESLDFVMAGASHFQNKGITDFPEGSDDIEKALYFLRNFEYAVSLPWVDVIAHPFFVHPNALTPGAVEILENKHLRPSLEIAKENGVAMEMSRRIFHTPEQLIFSARFYALCKEIGLKFTIGSDAHELKDIGNIRVLRPFIKEMGLTDADFWMPEHR